MKVVVNRCWGGFSLSREAVEWLRARGVVEALNETLCGEHYRDENGQRVGVHSRAAAARIPDLPQGRARREVPGREDGTPDMTVNERAEPTTKRAEDSAVTRPVLFLDVDGVLNSYTWFAAQPPTAVTEVDPAAVRRIQRIVAATNAYVVLSSSWRKDAWLIEKLRGAGVPIDDVTPVGEDRGAEIGQWLIEHDDVSNYAILDDDADAGRGQYVMPSRFVRTYTRSGMYGKHEKAVVALLSDGQRMEEAK